MQELFNQTAFGSGIGLNLQACRHLIIKTLAQTNLFNKVSTNDLLSVLLDPPGEMSLMAAMWQIIHLSTCCPLSLMRTLLMPGYRLRLTASPPRYHRIPPTDTHLTGNQGSCLPSTLPRQLAGTGRSEWPVFPGSGRAHWEAGARRLRRRQIELATVSRTLLASLSFRSRWPSRDQLEFFIFFFQIDWKRVNSGPDSLFFFFAVQQVKWKVGSDLGHPLRASQWWTNIVTISTKPQSFPFSHAVIFRRHHNCSNVKT